MEVAQSKKQTGISALWRAAGCSLSLASACLPSLESSATEPAPDNSRPTAVATLDPGADALQEASFAKKIETLGSHKWDARERATAELIEAGPAALKAVVRAQASKDPEVVDRARRIETEIRRPLLSAPSTVTLEMHDQPVSSILDAIERQTGNRIERGILDDSRISVSFAGKPFWEALLHICRESGNTIFPDAGPTGWHIKESNFSESFFSANGPFLMKRSAEIEVWSIHQPLPAPLPGGLPPPPLRVPGLGLTFDLLTEPRLAIDGYVSHAVALEAMTDAHEKLSPVMNNTRNYRSVRLEGRREHTCLLEVSWPFRRAETLSGTLAVQAVLLGNPQKVTLSPSRTDRVPLGDGEVQVLEAGYKPDGEYHIALVDTLSDQKIPRAVVALDEHGRRIHCSIQEGTRHIEGQDRVSLTLTAAEQPAALEYNVYRFSVDTWWKFALRNFSLPDQIWSDQDDDRRAPSPEARG